MRHDLRLVAQSNNILVDDFIRIATQRPIFDQRGVVEEAKGSFSVSTFWVDELVEDVKRVLEQERPVCKLHGTPLIGQLCPTCEDVENKMMLDWT